MADATSTTADLARRAAEVRARLALALDVDDLVEALRLAGELQPVVRRGQGRPRAVQRRRPRGRRRRWRDVGFEVFLDLKLHDIPTTVRKAARVLGALGASYLTLHTRGRGRHAAGRRRRASRGRHRGRPGRCRPASAVTVLTSDADAVRRRWPSASGCAEAGRLRRPGVRRRRPRRGRPPRRPDLLTVVPGIRPAGVGADDQARPATPAAAIAAGADLLVIGRAVTHADDPAAAAAAIAAEVAAAL